MADAMEAMSAELLYGEAQTRFRGISLDSRKIVGGELFFALPGEAVDGHRFVGAALAAGAAGAVVTRPVDSGQQHGALLRVKDGFAALHDLTRAVRRRLPQNLVAITGSAGKTSTKELLAAMLARRYKTAATPGNLNNLYGFPVALLGIDERTEWMVAEMGMSTPGELGGVSRLGLPDAAVFLNVRPAHLEAFDREGHQAGLDEILEAKAELLEGLRPDGLVVFNAADPATCEIARRHLARGRARGLKARALGFALDLSEIEKEWEVPLTVIERGPRPDGEFGTWLRVRSAGGESAAALLHVFGDAALENVLAAATCGVALGVPLADCLEAAAGVRLLAGRGEVREVHGAYLVDDTYNSNPSALSAAAKAARSLPAKRHWAVVGAMLELGAASKEHHLRAGEELAAAGWSPIFAVGEEAKPLAVAAQGRGAMSRWFADAAPAAAAAVQEIAPGDVVLIKGSRGIALERVVAALVVGDAA